MFDKILSYCDCNGVEPVEFEKIEEDEKKVIAKCTKCGRITEFPWYIWYGVCPEDVFIS